MTRQMHEWEIWETYRDNIQYNDIVWNSPSITVYKENLVQCVDDWVNSVVNDGNQADVVDFIWENVENYPIPFVLV